MILDLTIAIPVKNEEQNLQACLSAIGKDLVAEIVIIDSGSSDNTKQIALINNVVVIDFVWNGTFPKKRNWFLRNYPIKTKWVMFLDADEYLTDEFKAELKSILETTTKVGYWLNYSIYFMGKKLKGGYPLKKLALFVVGAGEYEKIDEGRWSNLDMEVHEHPLLKGETGSINNKIDHHDVRGISHYLLKHSEYADWEARRYLTTHDNCALCAEWTWKQRLKYRLLRSVLIGPVYFFGCFFYYQGFRDGEVGFAFAILKMSYFTQIFCKIRELEAVMNNLSESDKKNTG